MANGLVSLVGAGPGDPELWTVRAVRRVESADLILYDALVDAAALRRLTSARCFCVGKRYRRASVRQETIHRLMIRAARDGKRVVRLKGGDPFVFGRGGEEALALAQAGIDFEIVPGVTSAVAAAALAEIPVTHRGLASGFVVIAGQTGQGWSELIEPLPPNRLTLVVMMGLAGREEIVASLVEHGWKAATPAAVVCAASTAEAWTWTGTLADAGTVVPPDGVPGVLIVGDVIRVREALAARRTQTLAADTPADEVRYGRNR